MRKNLIDLGLLAAGFALAHLVAFAGDRWRQWWQRLKEKRWREYLKAAGKWSLNRVASRQWRRQEQRQYVAGLAQLALSEGKPKPPRRVRRAAERALVQQLRHTARAAEQAEQGPRAS